MTDAPPARSATVSPARLCRPAVTAEDLDWHYRIRHQVFVDEQGLFAGSDRDEHDADPGCVHVLGLWRGIPAGTVRLFPLDLATGLWQGDRLAVLPDYRLGLGAALVRFAVATAGEQGGDVMAAHVQVANVGFFERLGWTAEGDVESYVGVPHRRMTIPLHP